MLYEGNFPKAKSIMRENGKITNRVNGKTI
jgi:hypothetical protein